MTRCLVCLLGCLIGSSPALAQYNFYPPPVSQYPLGDASTAYPWSGEFFENYSHNQVVETSSNKSMQSHLEVTSGTLTAKTVGSYKRGWTETHNFRVLAQGLQDGKRIRWEDQVAEYRGYPVAWHNTTEAFQGMHIFARYQTEENLYVASIRKAGELKIWRKTGSDYFLLADGNLPSSYIDSATGKIKLSQWYRLTFSATTNASGNVDLKLFVDNTLRLSATDSSSSKILWGTTGIRTDYMNLYLDDWRLVYAGGPPNPEPGTLALLAGPAALGLMRRSRGRA